MKNRRIWKSVQLMIAFHKDPQTNMPRKFPKIWNPKGAKAGLQNKPDDQEAFALLKSDATETGDVQIKFHPSQVILRRDPTIGWDGVSVDETEVIVRVGGIHVRIGHDGSVKRTNGNDTTFVEADGAIVQFTEFAEIMISPDGQHMSRKTPYSITAVSDDGVLQRQNRD